MRAILLSACLLLLSAGALQAATLTGAVSRSDTDEPVSGASLLVRGTDLTATTAIDGTYTIPDIPDGHYGISCGAAGLRGQSSGAVDLNAAAQQNFSLEPPGEEHVQISGNAQCGGTPCAGVLILALQESSTRARAVSAVDGSFHLYLAEGDYDFRALAHRYQLAEQSGIPVSLAAPTSLSFNLTAAPHMYQIQGVVGLSDNPLDRSGSSVQLHGQAAPVNVVTDLGGGYLLMAVPAGLLSLSATHAGYDTGVQIDVLVTEDRRLDWALRKSGSSSTTDPVYRVRGVVRLLAEDGDGGMITSTASDTRVSVFTSDGSYQKSDGTDGEGRFEISGLPAGRYLLGAGREGYLSYQGEEFVLEADRWVELELEPDPDYDFGPGGLDGDLGCGCSSAGAWPITMPCWLLLALALRRRSRS